MREKRYYIGIIATLIFLASACLEPYQPPAIDGDVDILVVDGFLNTTDGSATVKLSHAKPLSSPDATEPEMNATVRIQDEGGNSYSLLEQEPGTYTLPAFNVDPAAKYRVSIRTQANQDYASDYVSIIPAPAIDSITWEAKDNGVNIRVNTHDASGNTRYYRWDYVETWQYRAAVSSDFILKDKIPVYRTNDERIYTCWRTLPSTKITIASTIRLAEDIISQYPVTFIEKGSRKLMDRYSILLKQRGVSKNEYDFLDQLQKTTESIGGLFDAQPSQVVGNMHNLTNPSTPVLGYFSAGAVSEQRFFLEFNNLPDNLRTFNKAVGCEVDSICTIPGILPNCSISLQDISDAEILGSPIYSGISIVGFTRTSPRCADCRLEGGSLTKPDFWP